MMEIEITDWADDVIDWEPCSGCVAYDDGMDCEKVIADGLCPLHSKEE